MERTPSDVKNTLKQHALVGIFSLLVAYIFVRFFDVGWSTSFARVSYILLFLTLTIGPVMRLKRPKKHSHPLEDPWRWRGELGIWFTITALLHFYFAMSGWLDWSLMKALGGGIGGGGLGLANLLGLIALAWALVLTATSFNFVIKYLGIESWKWLQRFAYVVFYLVFGHLMYFQFFTTHGGGPDWFGYLSIVMFITVIVLQISGFVKAVVHHRNEEA
ncbi:MAG: hypothetical protein ABEJ72_07055 [Candidatus Aenigmatarchaeota archaeon]